MRITSDSHIDHVSPDILDFVIARYQNKSGFFIETIELPANLGTLDCGLYGPIMGDSPIYDDDIDFRYRGDRTNLSRVIGKPVRQTSLLTVIAGPHNGIDCVLYTCFGGPATPKEATDNTLTDDDRQAAIDFWSVHALCDQQIGQ